MITQRLWEHSDYGLGLMTEMSRVLALVQQLKTESEVELMHIKSMELKVLPLAWFGSLKRGCQFRCRPCHLP
ncbi:hypothetical protein TNCV_815861 [Trichonephila clavipes]|nr:hypothetical protein TNCV_815861 [Trichonephila clavipes]